MANWNIVLHSIRKLVFDKGNLLEYIFLYMSGVDIVRGGETWTLILYSMKTPKVASWIANLLAIYHLKLLD